ncbi:MAG: hypothetical protein HQK76_20325 [Desulfobacterales bacterium]|nr:hypothetical protein [Desulfobacterales bacterium]
MNVEEIYIEFDKIEEKIEFLVQKCKDLESSNSEMNEKIRDLEDELQKKTQIEGQYTEHKSILRTKVDSLLAKLNSF